MFASNKYVALALLVVFFAAEVHAEVKIECSLAIQ